MTANTEVDDFLAHYGVLGMHWGQRKAEKQARKEADRAARKEIMKGKDLDQIVERYRQEKKLDKLVNEDLYPKKVAGRNFVDHVLKENGLTLAGVGIGAVTAAAGVGMMALRLSSKFKGISLSAIPLR